ncbi:porin [Aquibium microcysteis]|uniref:porin n=1 Tax=Aquibium microcysteis TaxID=675281 RepID=UPI00165CFEA2|nr:porin [Aquibium microcysteis]
MNIKSLLLGSAAALVAVTGARAADAVVIAEPEPVEYVRVCDAYGAGFFYIPGTETCLKFDGYVRMQVNASGGDEVYDADPGPGVTLDRRDIAEGWRFNTRARLNVDARSDTEWGTLRGYMRIQADAVSNTDAAYGMDQAIVQLGGFYVGYTESAWAAPWGLPGIARFGILHTDNGGAYAYQQRQQIGYTFSGGNGVFGSIVLEDDTIADVGGEGYMPDVVGVLGISQGWGGVWGKAAYDESNDEWAGMIGMQYNIPNMAGSNIRAGVFYASGTNAYALSMPVSGAAGANAVEWSVAGSYNHKFNAQWSGTVGGQYFEAFNGNNAWMVQGAVVWAPVTNFEVRLEGSYADEDNVLNRGDGDAWNGFLRFTRYF